MARKRINRLQDYIKEQTEDMGNTDYYYLMKELSEWCECEANTAELGWRNAELRYQFGGSEDEINNNNPLNDF